MLNRMTIITSPSNPRISKLQQLHTTRGRKKSGLFLMEGPHLLEALLDAQVWPHEVYYQPELLQRTAAGRTLHARLLNAFVGSSPLRGPVLVEVSERVIEAISDAQTSQGVISVLPLSALQPEAIQARRVERARP